MQYLVCEECKANYKNNNLDLHKRVEELHYLYNKPTTMAIKKHLAKKFGIKWGDITVKKTSWLNITVPPWNIDTVEQYCRANADLLGIGTYWDDMNEYRLELHVECHERILNDIYQQAEEGEELVRDELQQAG